MSEVREWCCRECGAILGWLDDSGLSVNQEAVERYTIVPHGEELWATCHCGHIQIWRAQAELPQEDGKPSIFG